MCGGAFFLPLFLLSALSPAQPAPDQDGVTDPTFAALAFDEWFATPEQSRIRWTANVSDPVLSHHQRLFCNAEIRIDGVDLAKRRGKGEIVMMIQITDDKGHVWQGHDSFSLEPVQESIKASDIQFLQPFFALPGDYTLSLAIFDTVSSEHNVARRKLHVPGLRPDPLPGAWTGMPAIEFIRPAQAPAAFFMPGIASRLQLPVNTKQHVSVDLLVNLTPSERFSGSNRMQNRNLGVLLPIVKLLTHVDWLNSTLNVALIDLFRLKDVYEQNDVKDFDWDEAQSSLAETKPGIIDVKSLESRKHAANFFVKEVNRRVAAEGPARVLIILSSSVVFEPGVELHPAESVSHSNLKIFYLRYQPLFRPVTRGSGGGDLGPVRSTFGPQNDQLEPLLKGLNPRRFDFTTPEQFRKALATMLTEIATL